MFHEINEAGAPFPRTIDKSKYDHPADMEWHYIYNSEKSFAIMYVYSSDGAAIESHTGKWRYVGPFVEDYEPIEAIEKLKK